LVQEVGERTSTNASRVTTIRRISECGVFAGWVVLVVEDVLLQAWVYIIPIICPNSQTMHAVITIVVFERIAAASIAESMPRKAAAN
jgi:hypothetical protein